MPLITSLADLTYAGGQYTIESVIAQTRGGRSMPLSALIPRVERALANRPGFDLQFASDAARQAAIREATIQVKSALGAGQRYTARPGEPIAVGGTIPRSNRPDQWHYRTVINVVIPGAGPAGGPHTTTTVANIYSSTPLTAREIEQRANAIADRVSPPPESPPILAVLQGLSEPATTSYVEVLSVYAPTA